MTYICGLKRAVSVPSSLGLKMAEVTRDSSLYFGEPVIVNPTGRHQATIVWLHDRNGSAHDASEFVKGFSLYNVKWICPSAPSIDNQDFGGARPREWFNWTNPHHDLTSLNLSASHVAGLLKDEPKNVMKGVAGYGVGGALGLYIASLYALGSYPFKIHAVVGINCWLPCGPCRFVSTLTLHGARSRAGALPVLVTHGYRDTTVPYETGKSSADELRKAGFQVELKTIHQNDHNIVFQTMTEVSLWLTRKLKLEGP